jgi:uncharacterized protein DUF6755
VITPTNDGPAFVGRKRPDEAVSQPPPPGQAGLVLAGLAIGLLLLGVQLWLLTIALDLYLAGAGQQIWQLALASGAIFVGGLFMLRLLNRRPRVRRTSAGTPGTPRQ